MNKPIKMPPFKPELLHTSGLSYDTPLMGTKFVEGLDNKNIIGRRDPNEDKEWDFTEYDHKCFGNCTVKDVAEYFNVNMLTHLYTENHKLYNEIRSRYTAALRDGIFEASNNLGIMSTNMEKNDKTALYYFDIGVRHGIQTAIVNKVRFLSYLDFPKAVEFLLSIENNEPGSYECIYDLAVLYFYGVAMKGNPIRQDKTKAKELLRRIIDNKEEADKVDDIVAKNAVTFLSIIDSTNLYTLNAEYFLFYLHNVFMIKGHSDIELSRLTKELVRIMPLHGTKIDLRLSEDDKPRLVIAYNDGEVMDFNSYADVEPSAMGAWQFYLFYVSPMIISAWQGKGDGRTYIFSHDALQRVLDDVDTDIEPQKPMVKWLSFDPQVSFDNGKATITCFYWNKKEGLVRETATVIFDGNKVANIDLQKS